MFLGLVFFLPQVFMVFALWLCFFKWVSSIRVFLEWETNSLVPATECTEQAIFWVSVLFIGIFAYVPSPLLIIIILVIFFKCWYTTDLLLYWKTLYMQSFFLFLSSFRKDNDHLWYLSSTMHIHYRDYIGISNNKENMKLLLLGTAKSFICLVAAGEGVTPNHPQCTVWLSRTKANTEHGIVWKNFRNRIAGIVFPWILKQTSLWEASYLCSRVHWLLCPMSHWIISKPEVLGRHQVTFWCKSPRWNNNSCRRATASRWGQGALCVQCALCNLHCLDLLTWLLLWKFQTKSNPLKYWVWKQRLERKLWRRCMDVFSHLWSMRLQQLTVCPGETSGQDQLSGP